jgi:hypothetical protein
MRRPVAEKENTDNVEIQRSDREEERPNEEV